MKKLRVAAYCRVSTDNEDQTNSLESQRKYFTEYINNHDEWQLVEVYYDEGISGTQTKKRIGFNTMISAALRGDIDLILTKETSRFARNTADTLEYTRKLTRAGVGVIFTMDNIDTRDKDSEFRLTIMASIAQEEIRKTSERVKWGQKRRMEQGVVFGRDLIGYRVKGGKMTVNEEEAPVIKAIFHKYTNEGKGTHVIARELQEAGMRPKRTKIWNNTIILKILRNEKYVGDLCQKKTFTPDYLTHSKKYNKGEEEMVYLTDHHEPVISRELWNRTREELRRRSKTAEQKAKYSNRYWCSGKLFCGECGQRYVSRVKWLKDGTGYKAWRCHTAANHGKEKTDMDGRKIGCANRSVNDHTLLYCMSYCVSHIQINKKELQREICQEIRTLKGTGEKENNGEQLQKEIEKYRHKKRSAIDLMLDGVISKEELSEQTQFYNEEIERLENRMSDIRQNDRIQAGQTDSMQQYIEALDEIMSFDEKNEEVYKEILDRITLYRDNTMEIRLKCIPFGVRIKYSTHGKKESYTTEITAMEITD